MLKSTFVGKTQSWGIYDVKANSPTNILLPKKSHTHMYVWRGKYLGLVSPFFPSTPCHALPAIWPQMPFPACPGPSHSRFLQAPNRAVSLVVQHQL